MPRFPFLVNLPGIALCCVTFLGAQALDRVFPLPLPPGVVGALVLGAALTLRALPLAVVAPGADRLLRHLGLLFVPAAVLSLRQRALLLPALAPLFLLVVLSTTLGLLVAGVVTDRLSRGAGPSDDGEAVAKEEEAGT